MVVQRNPVSGPSLNIASWHVKLETRAQGSCTRKAGAIQRFFLKWSFQMLFGGRSLCKGVLEVDASEQWVHYNLAVNGETGHKSLLSLHFKVYIFETRECLLVIKKTDPLKINHTLIVQILGFFKNYPDEFWQLTHFVSFCLFFSTVVWRSHRENPRSPASSSPFLLHSETRPLNLLVPDRSAFNSLYF